MPPSTLAVPKTEGGGEIRPSAPEGVNPAWVAQTQCWRCNQFGHRQFECPGLRREDVVTVNNSIVELQQLLQELKNKSIEKYTSVPIVNKAQRKRPLPKCKKEVTINNQKKRKRMKIGKEETLTTQTITKEKNEIEKEKDKQNKDNDSHKDDTDSVTVETVMQMDGTIKKKKTKEKENITAAYVVVKIHNKSVKALADSGASHNVVALTWIRRLKLEHQIRTSSVELVDAQNRKINVHGEIEIEVEFGKKTFSWTFQIAETLFCPLIIGMEVLKDSDCNFKKKYIELEGQQVSVMYTVQDHIDCSTITAVENKVVPPHTAMIIKGDMLHNNETQLKEQTYLVKGIGMVVNDVLETSIIDNKNNKESIMLLVENHTQKKHHVKRGDILAWASIFNEHEHDVVHRTTKEAETHTSFIASMGSRNKEMKHERINHVTYLQSLGLNPIAAPVVAIRGRHEKTSVGKDDSTEHENIVKEVSLQDRNSGHEIDDASCNGDHFAYNSKEKESFDIIVTKAMVEEPGVDNRIKDLKVSLLETTVNSKVVTLEGTQPEIWEGDASGYTECKLQEDQSSDEKAQFTQVQPQSVMSLADHKMKCTREGKSELPYVCVKPCNNVIMTNRVLLSQDSSIDKKKEREESVNSKQMLEIANNTLRQQIISEEEKKHKDKYKGATEEIIQDMVKHAICTEEEKKNIIQLLNVYKDVLVSELTPEFQAGNSYFTPHNIQLTHDEPIWTSQFPLSQKEKEIMEKEAQKQYRSGVIEPTTSMAYNSPVMVVPKKDGSWRPVIDFRNINKATIREQWALPRSEEVLSMLANTKVLSVIDATSGYWQIPLNENSKDKIAFRTMSGRWRYKTLPMGIKNAAPTFQRNMELMLGELLWKCCVVYIDDIIVFSNSVEEHLIHLEAILQKLRQCNMVIKPSKCEIMRNEVEYLGHTVGNGVLKTIHRNIAKIKETPLPQTLEEVRSFTMLASYYRKFIRKFAEIAKPLTDMMK